MSDPPVKTKRAGDLAATSPNCFELPEHSAIVCGAQTWCEHADTHIAIEPPWSFHFGKEICRNCGRREMIAHGPPDTEHLIETSLSRKCQLERSSLVWNGWQREAARLFTEFWRTDNERHLRAFFTHVVAMRVHAGRATQ
jgi:hypothetical protein